MQKTILIIIISFFSLNIFSQEFTGGIIIGVSGSQVDGDKQSGYKKAGLILGAFIKRPLSELGSFVIETYYIGKGAVLNIDNPDGTYFQEFNNTFHYVEMPFLYNLQLHPKINISMGLSPSYLFSHKLTNTKQVVEKSLYSMKSFDVQPIGQVDFFLTDRISSSVRISYSIQNIRNDELTVWRNNNLGLVFRYTFE